MTICTGGQHARAWGELRLVMAAMACSRDAADYTAPPGSSPWQWHWQRLWHWHINDSDENDGNRNCGNKYLVLALVARALHTDPGTNKC